jgi:hypothetical protein
MHEDGRGMGHPLEGAFERVKRAGEHLSDLRTLLA